MFSKTGTLTASAIALAVSGLGEEVELKLSPRAEAVRQRMIELEKDKPFTNQDGTIVVRGAKLDGIDKMRVMGLAEEVKRRAQPFLGVSLAAPRFRVVITDEDVETLGGEGVAGKLCRHWIAAAGIPAPAWVGDGLALWLDETRRQAFADRTLLLLERSAVPAATTLLDPEKQDDVAKAFEDASDDWDALRAIAAHWYLKDGHHLEPVDRDASWIAWVNALRLKRWITPQGERDATLPL
ncbi:MAG: hypothetical protein FWF84_04200 [Kiritimatiellaeota bacterium]|nr:hypothetical protein [Kiritimatiellota bacterium]